MYNGLAITLSGNDEAQAASVAALEALPQVDSYAIGTDAMHCAPITPPAPCRHLVWSSISSFTLYTRTSAQVKAVTKAILYHKLNRNHRKHGDGATAASKRRSLLQTPIPPQNGILYNGERQRCCLFIYIATVCRLGAHCITESCSCRAATTDAAGVAPVLFGCCVQATQPAPMM